MATEYKKRRNRNRLLLIFPLISAVVIGLVAYAYVTSRREFKGSEFKAPDMGPQADLAMGKVHQVSTRDGRTEWVLDATSAQMVENENRVMMKDITMIFYPKGGGEVHISAGRGVISTETNDVEVSEEVVVAYDRYRLFSERLTYDKKQNRLISPKAVKIVSENSTLTADDMLFDVESRNSVFNGNIAGIIRENIRF